MRLTLAILTAFVITSILSAGVDHICHITGVFPPYGAPMFGVGPLLLASGYRFIFQVLGSYIMGIIAREKAMKAAWIMSILGSIFWVSGAFFMKEMGPIWYPLLGALLTFPSVFLGVRLSNQQSLRSA
jgi:hypothetical protein